MEDFLFNKPRDEPGHLDSRELYSDEFIEALARDFEFELPNVELLTEIYEVPHR